MRLSRTFLLSLRWMEILFKAYSSITYILKVKICLYDVQYIMLRAYK